MSVCSAARPEARPSHTESDAVRALYFVSGVTEPNLLPRLVEPFAKQGLVLERLHATAEDGDGGETAVDLRLATVDLDTARRCEGMLRAVVGVSKVIAVFESD